LGVLGVPEIFGLQLINFEPFEDHRGSWQRIFDDKAVDAQLGDSRMAQVSISKNTLKGTLRGMHSLAESYREIKVVLCLQGSVQDVVLDTRPSSPTFGKYDSFLLSENVPVAVVIPPGCAHGFLTLQDDSSLLYLMSRPYRSDQEICYRWNDPFWGVQWNFEPSTISEKDMSHDLFRG
jgi:dTDP-4-dehydrorhamnose 3,5-epimerase